MISQLFSVARHVGHLKQGSKPAQLYVRLSIRQNIQIIQIDLVSDRIFKLLTIVQQGHLVGKVLLWYINYCRLVNKRTTSASGIIKYYAAAAAAAFVCLHFIPYWIPEWSILSKSFELYERQPKTRSQECSTPIFGCVCVCGGAYILSSTDRLFRCITTLQCV